VAAEAYALYLACRDPRTPWYAKWLAAAVAAYAASPIDLIPDFIPVLGYLDDLVIVPLGVWLAVKLIPPQVLAECREQARARLAARRPDWRAALVVITIWLAAAALAALLGLRWLARRGSSAG
jgi:uncharacterized membrane protein YkvA (DUF1232 family)